MPLATENKPPGEDAVIDALLADIAQRRLGGKRDAHAKSTGLLKASFRVADGLAPEHRIGVFADPGHEYSALIRFSNATQTNDGSPDGRGVAIKLFGVEGPKEELADEPDAGTQDFLLFSAREFVGANVAEFAKIVAKKAEQPDQQEFIEFLKALNDRLPSILLATMRVFDNALDIDYHSTTPYLFGAGNAVKYRLKRRVEGDPLPTDPENLEDALAKSVVDRDHVLDFYVQKQIDGMPIEDATISWAEQDSPFVKVAEIAVEPQDITATERSVMAENMSFTPWRALKVHRPLGGINRARRKIYSAVSKKRHDETGAEHKEPTMDDFVNLP